MKRILLTGASGFIGRNLKEHLSDRYLIFSPSHKQLDLLKEKNVREYVLSNQIDTVIHAAVHVPMFNGPEDEYENDMKMFHNLYEMHENFDKIIYFGSGAEYDKRYDISMVKEEQIGEHIPVSDYGRAKFDMNQIARGSDNIYNLRLFGIFGKYELWQIKFLSNIICKALYDLPLTIRKDCYFDYLYIDDLVRIVEWFIENQPKHHDYNTCSGRQYQLSEFADMVLEVCGKDLPVILLNEDRNLNYSASNERLMKEIEGFEVEDIRDSLRDLAEYYRNKLDEIDYNILKDSR